MERLDHKATIEDIITTASAYIHKGTSLDLIRQAYAVAKVAHEGQFRKSGDPYIQHPLEVGYMLAQLHSSPQTICAGLLHDCLEDTPLTSEEMTARFGSDITSIVDGVTKISQLKYKTKEKALAKTHQKIILAMAKDIRVILVKLVDRVHNMRTLEFQPPEKQVRIAKETLDLYAPLAHRLGMYRIKAELEDLAWKYVEPEKYAETYERVMSQKQVRDSDIAAMKDRIAEILDENHITGYAISGRIKNIYSICKKEETKHLDFDQIFDLMALRVIVSSVEECYQVLGLVHGEWSPIPGKIKDYIATPKPNLYQSLHTTVVGIGGKIFEIQIRTSDMDRVAEYGVAAHWAYKEENKGYTPQKEQLEIAAKMKWYAELLTYAEISENEDVDPLENLQKDVFSANVYVFTPNRDVFDFPAGATPLDFAYRIHTELGNHTVGAIVNGKIVPLTYTLKTGDVIEIKTSKSFNGPNEAWIKIVRTTHAKHKIMAVLNKRNREKEIAEGKTLFEGEAHAQGENGLDLSDARVARLFAKLSIRNVDDFYAELGKGTLSPKLAVTRLSDKGEKLSEEQLIKMYQEQAPKSAPRLAHNDWGVVVDGLDKAQMHIAPCCHPVLGDQIIGYVSKGSGIVVHRLECHNVTSGMQERIINVFWDPSSAKKKFEAPISVTSFDKPSIIPEIINAINATTVAIQAISSQRKKNKDLLTKIRLSVNNLQELETVMAAIQRIPDIYAIERVIR